MNLKNLIEKNVKFQPKNNIKNIQDMGNKNWFSSSLVMMQKHFLLKRF